MFEHTKEKMDTSATLVYYEDYIDILIRWANQHDVDDFPRDRDTLKTIKELVISDLSLYTIPIELFYLTQLEKLRFFNTKIEAIPKEINLLVNLKSFSIYYNENILKLPSTLGELSKLEELIIYKSSLDNLPKEIGKLSNLIVFELSYELSIKSLPTEFGNLKNLQELTIVRTNIETFPKEFKNLKKLTYVYFENNQIREFPSFLTDNKSLIKLVLSEDKISSIPKDIKHLKYLKMLHLHGNLETLPNEICHLEDLMSFNIWQFNPLKSLPKDMKKLISRGDLMKGSIVIEYDSSSVQQQNDLLKGFSVTLSTTSNN